MSDNQNNEQVIAALYTYKMPGLSELRQEWMAEYAIQTDEDKPQLELPELEERELLPKPQPREEVKISRR